MAFFIFNSNNGVIRIKNKRIKLSNKQKERIKIQEERKKSTRRILQNASCPASKRTPDVLVIECPDQGFKEAYKRAMFSLNFKSPSIVPSLGGAFVFIETDKHRIRSVAYQTKERLKIFSTSIEEILLSVHGNCKWIAKKGNSFKNEVEETEALVEYIERAMPLAEKYFGSYNLPIRGIIFPPRSNEQHPPPIMLDF
ncbi:hypothetical protein KKB43_02020 [Patescibacteria group bacterium]|nr:hypothetical protein [Patescibacteria group bacterium]MBU4579771.1 hypothetical protein [Patescibacteria group bacterium]